MLALPKRIRPYLPYLTLILVFGVARYTHLGGFGLYEDDLALIPNAFQMTQGELFRYIGDYILNLHGHARPLSNSLVYLFSNWGWRLAGLSGPYLFGLLLESLNLCLFYALLRRSARPDFAMLGGLAYALFSADTSQAFLIHSLGLHPSLTLLLLAAHAYLSKRRPLAYLLAGIILFAYESPFLVLLGVPLLDPQWDWPSPKTFPKALLKAWLRHALILGLMLAAVFLLRRALGDGRVSELGLGDLLTTPLLHMLQGPPVSLGSYLLRPLQALQALAAGGSLAWEVALASLVGFVLFFSLLSRQPEAAPSTAGLPGPAAGEIRRLALAGAVMLFAAYPLTFTVRAYAISGRDTRVHAAAVVGAAICMAVLFSAWLRWTSTRRPAWGKAPVAILLALLLGYGFVVQHDYTLAWQLQQRFWSELLPLIADVEPGTVILIEPSGLQDTRQIGANTWNLPVVIEKLYQFPPGWGTTPRTLRLQPGWQARLAVAPQVFWLNAATVDAPETYYQQVDTPQVIFITTTGGSLQRFPGPIVLDGQEYPLKPPGPLLLPPVGAGLIQQGFLYNLLIQNPSP